MFWRESFKLHLPEQGAQKVGQPIRLFGHGLIVPEALQHAAEAKKSIFLTMPVGVVQQNREQIAMLCQQYRVARLELIGSASSEAEFDPEQSDINLFERS